MVTVPTVELPPTTLSTDHVTAVLVAPWIEAVNCCVPVLSKWIDPAVEPGMLTDSVILMVTLAEADLVLSAWLVAVMMTVCGLGTKAGAVYRPDADIVPTVELPPVTTGIALAPTPHVTAVFVVLVTVALNWYVCPTVNDEGEVPSVIATAGGVVGVVVGAGEVEWHPTITAKLTLIPKTHAIRRRPSLIDPTPSNLSFASIQLNATATRLYMC